MDTDIRVLAVDDVEFNLDLIEVMLTGLSGLEDLTMLRAMNGRAALDILEQHSNIDIILLDLEMPVLNGFDTLQILKLDERYREIPVIVVTARAQSIDKVLGLHIAKVDDYIAKPFSPQELLNSVDNVLAGKKNV